MKGKKIIYFIIMITMMGCVSTKPYDHFPCQMYDDDNYIYGYGMGISDNRQKAREDAFFGAELMLLSKFPHTRKTTMLGDSIVDETISFKGDNYPFYREDLYSDKVCEKIFLGKSKYGKWHVYTCLRTKNPNPLFITDYIVRHLDYQENLNYSNKVDTTESKKHDTIPDEIKEGVRKAEEKFKEASSTIFGDFQDNEDYIYASGKATGPNPDEARQSAVKMASFFLELKIMSDERYRGFTVLPASEIVYIKNVPTQDSFTAFITLKVARKDIVFE